MTFLYPLFLWSLICLSIPVIIHFFYFNKYKRVSFSNVLMLKELKEEQTTKNKIKKWWVLLSRLLILFFLVMAFAQPFLGSMDKRASASWSAIYIDNSMSMSIEDGGGMLLNQARSLAKKYISLQGKTMRFHIISNDIGKSKAKFLTSDEAINELDNIKLSASEVDLDAVYRKQTSILDEKEGIKDISWFSDFQKLPLFENISDEIDLNLFALRADDYVNVYIDSVWTDPEYLNLKTNSNLCIQLSSNSEDEKEVTIEVLVNKKIRAIKNIAFSGKSIIDTVGVVFSESSWNSTEVRISDFPVTFDNTYHVSFKVSDKIKVLSLFDDFSSRSLNNVLAQDNIMHSNKMLDDFNIVDFEDCSICILDGLDRISETLQTSLVQFVKKGGDLVIFPSENIDSYTYDALSRKLNLAKYGSVHKKATYLRQVNVSSDLFDGVFKEIPRNVEWPWINSSYEMINTSGNYYPSNLEFSNGAPLLFEHKHNLSQIYQFGIGLDSSFSNLDKHILFPPLIYNIIVQSEDGSRQSLELGKEHLISMKFLKAPNNPGDISLLSNRFEMFPERRKINGELMLVLGRDIVETGFYNLMNGAEKLSQYAFNFPKEESSLPYIKLEDTQLRSKIKALNQIDRLAIKKGSFSLDEKSQLWKLCLIFVVAFIIVESLLLKYF